MPSRKKEPEWKLALRDAIEEAGSQVALAKLIYRDDWKKKRTTIVMALQSEGRISAELAAAVAAVTSVSKHRLRPDLWGEGDG